MWRPHKEFGWFRREENVSGGRGVYPYPYANNTQRL